MHPLTRITLIVFDLYDSLEVSAYQQPSKGMSRGAVRNMQVETAESIKEALDSEGATIPAALLVGESQMTLLTLPTPRRHRIVKYCSWLTPASLYVPRMLACFRCHGTGYKQDMHASTCLHKVGHTRTWRLPHHGSSLYVYSEDGRLAQNTPKKLVSKKNWRSTQSSGRVADYCTVVLQLPWMRIHQTRIKWTCCTIQTEQAAIQDLYTSSVWIIKMETWPPQYVETSHWNDYGIFQTESDISRRTASNRTARQAASCSLHASLHLKMSSR